MRWDIEKRLLLDEIIPRMIAAAGQHTPQTEQSSRAIQARKESARPSVVSTFFRKGMAQALRRLLRHSAGCLSDHLNTLLTALNNVVTWHF